MSDDTPSLLVVVAHPDDEALGSSALIGALEKVHVVHLTDGAPRRGPDAVRAGFADPAAYARARRREALDALGIAGVAPERIACLGFADQELSLHLAGAARALCEMLRALRPAVVLTLAYEGGHPDHDATAFAAHAAAALLADEGPTLLEMGLYHEQDGQMRRLEPPPGAGEVMTLRLGPDDLDRKRAMFECYATQRAVLADFPIDVERFRPAPRHDFTRAPFTGPLHYERYDWGMTGERFRQLAVRALEELGLLRRP